MMMLQECESSTLPRLPYKRNISEAQLIGKSLGQLLRRAQAPSAADPERLDRLLDLHGHGAVDTACGEPLVCLLQVQL